jgi:outer membrane protein assembly factor BamE (lipoprotein component of BamABCDE complex)|tara:strand:- start:15 stop:479 length:465 start_codon:yes stop_codon:yes gene_type:complete
MKNIFIVFFAFLLISNCTLNKVIKHHGVYSLDKKKDELKVNITNKNDIIKLLGPPSTSSTFNENLMIYIERNTSTSRLSKLGKKKLLVNNTLVLELDNRGLLVEKVFLNKDDMKDLKFSEDFTQMSMTKKSFVYEFLGSVRSKINDPLGKKKTK